MDENAKKLFAMTNRLYLLLLVLSGLASAAAWSYLPDVVMVPDMDRLAEGASKAVSKAGALGAIPLSLLITGAIIAALPHIEPRRSNLVRSARAYAIVSSGIGIVLAVIHGILLVTLVTGGTEPRLPILVLAGLLLAVIGNYMGKLRSNFMFGFRTPWTLSSDLSWDRTHRLGGRVMVLFGLLLPAGFLFLPIEIWIVFWSPAFAASLVALIVYSFVVWKNDPDRRRREGRG